MARRAAAPIAPPALTPEAREQQMIALATDLAEQQLRDGTAKASVIVHYLKMASPREELERDMLRQQHELTVAKTEALHKEEMSAQLYENAIAAMRSYSPTPIAPGEYTSEEFIGGML